LNFLKNRSKFIFLTPWNNLMFKNIKF
jgi:hypothetical protein